MALKNVEKSVVKEDPPPQSLDTVTLELTMYNHYTWGGTTYERGTAYKFKRDDAMALLAEEDHGRAVWRMYQPPRQKTTPRMPLVDSTEVKATRSRISLEEAALRDGPGANTGKRIEVGTDDEIADILNKPDESGDVTV